MTAPPDRQLPENDDRGHETTALPFRPVFRGTVVFVLLVLAAGHMRMRSDRRKFVRETETRLTEMGTEMARIRNDLDALTGAKAKAAEFGARWEKGTFFSPAIGLAHSGGEARGVAWVDYDGDGDLDVLICSNALNQLYRNTSGLYADVTDAVGLRGGSRCASWADYDGDGDMDLFYSTGVLWTNDGGQFVGSPSLIPAYPFSNTEGAGWLDANADGMPDVMVADGDSGIHLMLNRGGGEPWFVDVEDEWGLGRNGIGVGNGDFLSLADYDGDGFTDFLYNLKSGVLGRNMQGRAYGPADGANVTYVSESPWKFGTAFGDWDNDGDLDLFVPQNGRPFLYQNRGNGSFNDVTRGTGELATAAQDAQSAAWGDVNVDGFLDLVVGYGRGPLRVFINEATGEMTDESLAAGMDLHACAVSATGMAMADFDEDGDVDVLVTGERTESGIIVNDWPRTEGWYALRVRLPNTEAPGAVIRVFDGEKELRGMRQVGLVQTFSAQGPWEALFGLDPGQYDVSVLRTTRQEITHRVTIEDRDMLLSLDIPKAETFAESAAAMAPGIGESKADE